MSESTTPAQVEMAREARYQQLSTQLRGGLVDCACGSVALSQEYGGTITAQCQRCGTKVETPTVAVATNE